MEPPVSPKTTFTVSLMEAGHAIHAIAQKAVFKINLRSDDPAELDILEQRAIALFKAGAEAENSRWGKPLIFVEYKKILDIPSGSQPDDCHIVQAAWQAISSLGLEPRLIAGGCTNANMAIDAGIPAVTLGLGGTSGGVHTLEEWFDPTNAYLSVQNSLLLLLALAGVHGVSDSVLKK
jgi:acetylornithine deacetylase/succinyl-diaminopimelate desuccinylase-like protein